MIKIKEGKRKGEEEAGKKNDGGRYIISLFLSLSLGTSNSVSQNLTLFNLKSSFLGLKREIWYRTAVNNEVEIVITIFAFLVIF